MSDRSVRASRVDDRTMTGCGRAETVRDGRAYGREQMQAEMQERAGAQMMAASTMDSRDLEGKCEHERARAAANALAKAMSGNKASRLRQELVQELRWDRQHACGRLERTMTGAPNDEYGQIQDDGQEATGPEHDTMSQGDGRAGQESRVRWRVQARCELEMQGAGRETAGEDRETGSRDGLQERAGSKASTTRRQGSSAVTVR